MRSILRALRGLTLVLVLSSCLDAVSADPDAEVSRIGDHLTRVGLELRGSPTGHLTPQQKRARLESIRWLEEYRASGVFPHNHVRMGERVPVFVDPHGTPCAVAYLLLRSGEDELVEEIARESNLIRIPELSDDMRVVAWLEDRGLTLEEAARIQPAYGGIQPATDDTGPSFYRSATVGWSLLTLATASYSALTEPSAVGPQWAEAGNVLSLLGHTFLLVAGADTNRETTGWAIGVNVVGAALATYVTINRFSRRRGVEAAARNQVVVSPYVQKRQDALYVGVSLRH